MAPAENTKSRHATAPYALSGILSGFGFILSGPALDGASYAVIKYRWL
jgi:hypothetical protein